MTDAASTPTYDDFHDDPAFEATRALLQGAKRIAVMSGAGNSRASNPTPGTLRWRSSSSAIQSG